ncbi:MAG: hypothetical protein QM479_06700 [Pseudomonadota bacterium]
MSNKQELIKEMIEMQNKFIEFEHKNGIHPDDYYNPGADHELSGFKQKYDELSIQVLDIAHKEKGSGWKR